MNRRKLLANLVFYPAAASIFGQATVQNTKGGPRADYFPNSVLKTHENKEVRFYDDLIKGKIVVINMMYTRCEGICPGMTANLVKVQNSLGESLGRDIFMYSLTLQPEQDTPEELREYAQMYKTKPGWLFLTGKRKEVEVIRRKLGFFDPDPEIDNDKTQHTGLVRYGNESLDRWAACPALSNPEQIAKAIHWMEGKPGKQ